MTPFANRPYTRVTEPNGRALSLAEGGRDPSRWARKEQPMPPVQYQQAPVPARDELQCQGAATEGSVGSWQLPVSSEPDIFEVLLTGSAEECVDGDVRVPGPKL